MIFKRFGLFILIWLSQQAPKVLMNELTDESELDEPTLEEFYAANDELSVEQCSIYKDNFAVRKFSQQKMNITELSRFNPSAEAQILEFAVEKNRKLLLLYGLVTKSASQREEMLSILKEQHGSSWFTEKLQNTGLNWRLWKNPKKIIEALTTKLEDFNAVMVNKRFGFLVKGINKLRKGFKKLMDTLHINHKTSSKVFNSYMLTEILLESSFAERQALQKSYTLKFGKTLEHDIKKYLSNTSASFHIELLNKKRLMPDKSSKRRQQELNLLIMEAYGHLEKILGSGQKPKEKELEIMKMLSKYPIEVMIESFKKLRIESSFKLNDNSCLKTSTINTALKYLYDPNGYYANNIKTLLDQQDFGYYLSRVFFAYPKQKLKQIEQAFEQIYNVTLKDYVSSRLDNLNPNALNRIAGRFDAYSTYLRAIKMSLGDPYWCLGSCRVTQKEEAAKT